jgi:hypothetical protein
MAHGRRIKSPPGSLALIAIAICINGYISRKVFKCMIVLPKKLTEECVSTPVG